MACILVYPSFAQEPETTELQEAPEISEVPEIEEVPEAPESPAEADTVNVIGRIEVIETPDQTRVALGKNEVIIVEENGDTVRLKRESRSMSLTWRKREVPARRNIRISSMRTGPDWRLV